MKGKIAILILLISLIVIYVYRNNHNSEIKIIGGLVEHHIYLRPGETEKTEFVIYTSKTEKVRFEAYEVSEVGDAHKISTPSGLVVSITPSEAELKPNKKKVFNVTIKTDANSSGSHTFLIRAHIDGKTIDDWLRILVAKTPNPCFASLYLPRIEHAEIVKIKAGESLDVNLILHTEESPPGIVRFTVYRVKDVYKTKEIPMPKGLSVEVIPSERFVNPHSTYTFKIRIKTDRSLHTGVYVLCVRCSGTIGTHRSWITVSVR